MALLMYKRFYQLDTNPFRLAPEPDFCFSHSGYQSAMQYLEFALAEGEGFVMVTGRPGTGKTMLVETFLKKVNPGEVVARRIAVSSYGATELLRAVAYAYGIDATGMVKGTMRHRIQEFFVQQERAGRRVLLIIDEAQTLSHAALEELRILADLQTRSRLMLQLFLVGQESLQELMRTPDMEQFQQRVIANYKLSPLSLNDSRSYIEHRLLQAGWSGDPEFSSTAVLHIYQLSNGVPRHINKICNRLLLLGFGKGSHVLDEQDVLEISTEMRAEQLTPMAVNQATLYDINNVTQLSIKRDNQLSADDLAIRVDKLDPVADADSEDMELKADTGERFIGHQHVPLASNDERIVALDTGVFAAATSKEKPRATNTTHAEMHDLEHAAPGQPVVRPNRKKPLATIGVLLVLLLVIVVTLPSFPGREIIKEKLSFMDQESAALQEKPATTDVTSEQVTKTNDANSISSAQQENTIPPDTTGYEPAEGVINRQHSRTETSVKTASVARPLEQSAVIKNSGIPQLLAQGRQALDDYRLVTPEGDNAYEYLSAVLLQDPDNETAREGIQSIVDIYITLAAKAAGNNEIERANRYLDRGLGIQPGNADLLSLKNTVDSRMESTPVTQAATASAQQARRETVSGRNPSPLVKRHAAGRRLDISATMGGDS